jgi:hypothetical protein
MSKRDREFSKKKEEQDNIIPCIIEEAGVSPEQLKAWARLIQKIYGVDPLTFPPFEEDYFFSQTPLWDDDQTSESHTHHIVLPICPPKTHTTTISLSNQKAEIFNTSLSRLSKRYY